RRRKSSIAILHCGPAPSRRPHIPCSPASFASAAARRSPFPRRSEEESLTMRRLLPFLALGAAALAGPATAQPDRAGPSPVGQAGPEDTEKVKQVFVYGDDPCPPSEGDEIVVCARLPDNDRYRIPKELRADPLAPANQ